MGPNLAVLTQANSPLERGKINKRTLLNIWAWGVCSNSDCIASCLIFIFKRYILGKAARFTCWGFRLGEQTLIFSFCPTLCGFTVPVGQTRSLLAQTWGQDLLEPTSPFHAVQHLALFSASCGASVTLSCDRFILSGFYWFFSSSESPNSSRRCSRTEFLSVMSTVLAHPWEMAGDGNLAGSSGPKSPAVHGNEHAGPHMSEWKGASCCKTSAVLMRGPHVGLGWFGADSGTRGLTNRFPLGSLPFLCLPFPCFTVLAS